MQKTRNKTALIISTFLILSMAVSMLLSPNAAQIPPANSHIPTYPFINLAPNPAGVGQTVTINFFLATPLQSTERPVNMTVVQTNPDGTTKTLGPFTGDLTGGTFTVFTPDKVGNYTFQFIYGGQTLTGSYSGVINDPSISAKETLIVQEEAISRSSYPITPLPTSWWETPVSAENVQEWHKIMGPWLGFGSVTFATTGSYNASSFCNPYTPSVYAGHVLWTKVWAAGGVAGGDAGGSEDTGHYWSTRQYQPQYAPVIINGIMYSQQYSTTMGTNMGQGIQAVNLFTGETLWTINTTLALRCGMVTTYGQINQYGALGPFIWTTGTLPAGDTGGTQPANSGTQWNMYDATTGQYVLSIVNGSALTLRPDEHGNLIGYFLNNTAGTEIVHPRPGANEVVTNTGPHVSMVNMTMAIGQTGGSWQPARNTVRAMNTGIMWSKPVPTNISGLAINPSLSISNIVGNAVFMTGSHIAGYSVIASLDADTGAFLMCKNLTFATGDTVLLPWTRTSTAYGEGSFFLMNDVNYEIAAYDARTGTKVWTDKLAGDHGAAPNVYDLFSLKPYVGNGILYVAGLGGDIWAFNAHTGTQLWYTNTTRLIGDPGIETPYGIWPLWVFNCAGFTNDVAYLPMGHEYNPPLFHGAQMLAINNTDGSLIWSELGTYIRSTSIAYGIMLSYNAYDNQIYAFGKGPSQTTVSAPSVGVTTATPITITGRVTDIAEGSKRHDVAANFPNGLPCVSDASQSAWMEYVYQQQPCPTITIGVPVSISVLDANGNYRQIGSTTSDGSGLFSFTWTPDIAGDYTLVASFEGSASYYPSSAETAFHASNPAATPAPTDSPAQSTADTYFVPAIAGLFVLIIIVLAIQVLMIMRKRP
jgi:outer membrane protein assembly factor BamB